MPPTRSEARLRLIAAILVGVIALLLIAYLTVAMLRPEKF